MITQDDLNWWLELAPTLEWTFAKTYTDTAPHHYVVENRTPGVTHDDMVRAARVIATFGTPGKYYSLTKLYLTSPDGQYRWWTEDRRFTDANLVNRATTERNYGVQNAPSTTTKAASPFDALATSWDAEHPVAAGEPERLKQLLSGARGKYPPHVLDIGCGTGRVLDLGLVAPDLYAGLDSSQAMLNVLLRKHPRPAALYPIDVREALDKRRFTMGQFDWVFLDSSVELTDQQRLQVNLIARHAVIDIDGNEWAASDVSEASVRRIRTEAEAQR